MIYDVGIKFVPGKFLHIADTLSRAFSALISETTDLDQEAVLIIHTEYSNLSATSDNLKEI